MQIRVQRPVCVRIAYINGSYEKQLTEKEQYVRTQLKGICPVNPIIGMENPYHYRNKVTATFSYKKGEIFLESMRRKVTVLCR